MKTLRHFRTPLGGLMIALIALQQIAQPLQAASATWTGTGGDSLWLTTGNWSASPVPGAGDTATFNAAAGGGGAIINTGSISLGTLAFDTASAAAYTIGGVTAGSGQITFGDGTTNIITMSNTVAANQLVNANLILGTAIASNSTISNASTTNTLTIAGNITGGTGGTAAAKILTFSGAGQTIVSGNITKGGATSLAIASTASAPLTLSGTNSITSLSVTQATAANAVVNLGTGTTTIGNAGAVTLLFSNGGTVNGGTIFLNAGTAGTATAAGNYGDFGTTAGTLTVNSVIAGASGIGVDFFPSAGTVVLTGQNTFSGPADVYSTVSVSSIRNIGMAGNLGLGNVLGTNAGNISIGSTTTGSKLIYTGTGEVTNRTIALSGTTGGATLDMSGTGALHFTNTGSIVSPGAGAKTLTLTGSTAGVGRLDMVIPNASNGGALVSVAKTGTGTWILGGANTYGGTTAISGGGNLVFTKAQTLAGAVTWNNSGLTYAATTDAPLALGSTLTATGGATEVLGASIGSTATSAMINVTGIATATAAALKVNLYGISGVTPTTATYTLLQSTGASTLNNFSAITLGNVYNNTNFTVGALTKNTTSITAGITAATPITAAFWKGGLAGATNVWAASNGTTASNWTTTAGGAVQALVPGAGADVTISATAPTTAPTATVLGANMTIKSLTIADTTNGLGINDDGYTLTITPAAATAGITMNASVPASTIASGINLGAAQTWTNNSANALTVSGNITGTAALTAAGTGPLTIIGGGAYSGGLTVSGAKTLNLNTPNALGTGTFTIGAAATLNNGSGSGYTMTTNNAVAINSSFSVSGAADTTKDITFGTGAVTLGAAPTITVNSATNLTFGGTVALAANTLTKAGSGTLTLNGLISGSKAVGSTALSITGGTVAISNNANTFTGNIAVDGATSVFQVATGATYTTTAPWGTVAGGTAYKQLLLTNGGTFRLLSGAINDNAPTATNIGAGIIFNFGTGGGVLDIASGATLTIDDGTGTGTGTAASQIQGAGSITKTGLGTLSIDDSTAYAGAITVNAGLLQPASGNAFGATSAGTTINSGAALNVNGITMSNAEPLTINGTGLTANLQGALTNTSATAATWAGPVTLGSDSTIGSSAAGGLTLSSTAPVNIGANVLTIRVTGTGRIFADGVFSGTGSLVMNSSGSGDYVPRTDHTYSGGSMLTAGLIAVDRDSIGAPGSPTSGPFGTGTVTLNGVQLRAGAATNRTVGNTLTIAADTTFYTVATEKSLTFTGPATLTGGTRTITTNVGTTVPSAATVFSGSIGDGGNNFGLIKSGNGNLILSGNNTYGGGTTLNAGFLNITGTHAGTGNITVATPSYLSLIGNSANPINTTGALNLGSAAGTTILGLDLGTASDSLTGAAAATTAGNLYFNINAASGFGAGSYTLLSAPAGGLLGATYGLGSVPGGFTYALNSTGTEVTLTVTSGAPAASNFYWGAGSSSWATNANWFSDVTGTTPSGTAPSLGSTVFFSTTTATGPTIATTLDAPYTIDNLTFNANPTGVTAISIGAGNNTYNSLTLSPASSTNGINLGPANGTVTISAPITLGAPQTWTVDGTTGGTASALIVSGPISGSSTNAIDFNSANTSPAQITLSSTGNTYSGASSVGANMNVVGGAAGGFSSNTAWTVNGTLSTGAFAQTTGSLVGGSGGVQNGSGTGATLTIGNDNLGTSGSPATFGGTLQNGSTGALGITKVGTGVQAFTGNYSYTGATTVNGGILRLAGTSTGTSTVTVNTGGTLQFGSATALTTSNAITLAGTGILDLFANTVTIGGTFTNSATNTITNSSSSGAASTATTVGTPALTDALVITGAGQNVNALITDGGARKTQIVVNNANNGGNITTNTANTFSGGLVLANNATGTRMNVSTTITGTPWGTGPIIIGQTATDKASIYLSANNIISNPIVFNTGLGTDRFGVRSDVSGGGFSGKVTANVEAVFSSNSTTGAFLMTGQITGVGGLALDLSQTSTANTGLTMTLNNPAFTNNYQGDTVIGRANAVPTQNYSAILALGANDQIPNGIGSGNVILNSVSGTQTGRLNLAGFSDTINGLSGNGTVDGTGGTPTLTVGDNNATASFSGIIQNTAGTLTFTKIGSGTQTLSGANSFTGPINTNGGLVAFATSPATNGPLGNSSVINASGGGISYTGNTANALNRPIVIGGGNGTVNVVDSLGNLTISSITSTGGNLIKTGTGMATIAGSTTLNSGSAGVIVNDGTLVAGFGTGGISSVTIGATGILNMNNGAIEALTLGNSTGALNLAGGSRLGFELTNLLTNDSIAVGATGTAVTGGTVTLDFFGSVGAGTYNLLSSTLGGLIGASYVLGTAPNGFNYTINQSDTLISLTTVAYSPSYWNNTQGDGSWATVTGNLGSIGTGAGTNFTTLQSGLIDIGHAPTATETVIFNTDTIVGPSITTTLDGSRTIDSLQFIGAGSPAVTSVVIDQGTGSGTLTLDPASASGGISILTGGGNATINAPLALGNSLSASQTWNIVDATSTLNIAGAVYFGANVTKSGLGSLTLSGTNTGNGNIALTSGTLNINSNTALGSGGTLNISAGTTIDSTVGGVSITNTNPETWNGSFTFAGTNSLNLGSGAITLAANATVTTTANTLTLGGGIGETGGTRTLTKAGNGTLALTGNNTYSGLTTVNAGTLTLSGTNTTTGGTTINGGTLNINDAAALGSGALTINGGSIDSTVPGVTSNAVVTTLAGNFAFPGTNSLNLGTGAVTLTTSPTITTTSNTLTLGGNISGAFSLTKAGAGALTLAGTNSYTGIQPLMAAP